MNILIIGGNGYVGRHLAVKLKKYGHRISIVDKNDVNDLSSSGFSVNIGDFGDMQFMSKVLRQEHPELVIHAGGLSRIDESIAIPMAYYSNNVVGNVFLINMLLSFNIKKYIFVSSAAVFGEQDKLPVNKLSLRNPISPLGDSQVFVENMLEAFRLTHGISYAIMRAPNLAGLSEKEDNYFINTLGVGLIPSIMEYALGKREFVDVYGISYGTIDGTSARDYLHVDDFCEACLNVMPHLEVRREKQIFNVGLGRAHSVREVLTCAEKVIGKQIETKIFPEREGDPSRIYYDSFSVRTVLDWRPKYETLESIINSIWEKIKLSSE